MKKMKSALIIGTLIAALGASTVFAATSSTSDYDQNPHKMRDLVQQSMQEKNAGNDSADKTQYPGQNRGPGMGGCNKQGQMHKGPGMMREQGAKILADLTGRDVESIKEDARTNHKPIREMAKDAGVYDQFMTKHLELAKEHMNKAVADGKMTQEQADKMLQNMKDGKHQGQMGMGGKHMGHGPGMMQAENAKILADLTGRDVESIKEDARTNHKPIREMAKDAGVYDQFMAKHLELAKEHMNKAVADGKMTQEQADKMLQNMKDGKHFGPKDGMHKHMMQGPRNGDCQNND